MSSPPVRLRWGHGRQAVSAMMTTESSSPPAVARTRLLATVILVALAASTVSGDIVRWLAHDLPDVAYLRSALATLADLTLLLLLASWMAKRSPAALLAMAGWRKPIVAPLVWALLVLTPAWIACALWIDQRPPMAALDLFWKGVAFPFAEELIYRGLAIGLLVGLCGWRWLPACLAPALLFGVAHFAQGTDLGSIAGIVLITAMGGLLFGWLWVRWDGNLWPPVLLHAGMNSLWMLYGLGDNAIGGWWGNAMRAAIIVAAIGLTVLYRRRLAMSPPSPKG